MINIVDVAEYAVECRDCSERWTGTGDWVPFVRQNVELHRRETGHGVNVRMVYNGTV